MFKKLLSKIEKIEGDLKQKDKEIAALKQDIPSAPSSQEKKEFVPPKTDDPLANAIIRGAMKKASQAQEPQNSNVIQEVKEHHLGEIILFAKRKRIPLGNTEE